MGLHGVSDTLPLRCRFVGREGASALVPRWQALADEAEQPNVFFRPELVMPALESFDTDPSFQLLCVEQGESLVGLLPLRRTEWRSGRLLPLFVAGVHRFGPLGTPLIARGMAPAVTDAILEAFRGRGESGLLLPLLEDGPVAEAFDTALAGRGLSRLVLAQHERAALISHGSDGSVFEERRGKGAKNRARLARRLSDKGEVSVHVASGPDVAFAFQRFAVLEAAGWKGRVGTALTQAADEFQFFQRFLALLSAPGDALVAEMRLDGEPVACGLLLRHGTRAYYHKTAYREDLASFSPGLLFSDRLRTVLGGWDGILSADSCAVSEHPMINRVWPQRIRLTDSLVPTGHAPLRFKAMATQERLRLEAMARLKAARTRLRRLTGRARPGG